MKRNASHRTVRIDNIAWTAMARMKNNIFVQQTIMMIIYWSEQKPKEKATKY